MKVFRIKRLIGIGCPNDQISCRSYHWAYTVAEHRFAPKLFERLTGHKWERGYRTFRLVEVRPKQGSKRG